MKRILYRLADAAAVAVLFVMLGSYGCQKLENNDVLQVSETVQNGWTMAQCKAAYAPKKNLTVTQGKPSYKTDTVDFVIVLRLKNHPVLSENTYLTLPFKNGVLTQTSYLAFYKLFD